MRCVAVAAVRLEVETRPRDGRLSRILGRLEEFGYRGWVTIERQNSADPVGEIANAVAFLRAI